MTVAGSGWNAGSPLCWGSSLSKHCIPLSCAAAHGWLTGCSDSTGLRILCVCVRARFRVHRSVATIQIWRSPRNVAHSTGIPDIKVLHKFAWRSQGRRKNKRQEQEANIFSRVVCVSTGRSLLEFLSSFKAFAAGNLNEECASPHLLAESRGRKRTDLSFYLVCE